MGAAGRAVAARRLPVLSEAEKHMSKTVALAVLAVIVVIIAVQFGPALVSR
jgi:hypothetical protein